MMEEVDLADTPLAMRPQLQAQESSSASDEEPPDPRIQVELERLNTSTDLINKLEVDLDEARMMFRQTLLESTQQIDNLTKKLGKCVEQARPYYEARIKAKQALTEAQKSAVRYERAVSQHAAAREMVHLAEEGLLTRGCIFDSTWQEMLNHATTKVNDAEREKIESTSEHRDKSNVYHESETRVKMLQKELKRSIAKSSLNARRSLLQLSNLIRMQELQLLPYFELKAAVNQRLEEQKRHVRELEAAVSSAKTNYAQALTNLETISDQIHKNRQSRLDLGIRGVGVGAESPDPPCSTKHENEIAKQKSLETPIEKISNGEAGIPIVLTHTGTKPVVNGHLVSQNGVLDIGDVNVSFKDELSNEIVADSCQDGENLTQLKDVKNDEKNLIGLSTLIGDTTDHQGSYLSGWQFVAFPGLPQNASQSLLSVEDKESIVSDSESLTSMEMLSEEAIANLMLEDEINEASQSICSPYYSEEYLAPPSSKMGDPTVAYMSDTKKTNEKHTSQASSSDSGEPWEVVNESQEPPSIDKREKSPQELDPSNKEDRRKEEDYKDSSSTSCNDSDSNIQNGLIPTKDSKFFLDISAEFRPQTLPVDSQYGKSTPSSSSSSLNSNSFSDSFSPSYAPLSDTPDADSHLGDHSKMEEKSPAKSPAKTPADHPRSITNVR